MNRVHKLTALTLALLLASGTAACGSAEQQPDVTDTTAADTTTAEPEYELPTGDFGGKEFNIMLWEHSLIPVTEETGDVVDDALYKRNRTIEEMYNIMFNFNVVEQGKNSTGNFGQWFNTLNASILAGDDAIQLAGGYTYQLTSYTFEGGFANVLDLPHISYDKEWWPQQLMKAGNLGGSMNVLIGNLDPDFYGRIYAMFFNKKIAAEYKLPDFYELVKDGKWTLDKMMEITSNVSADLDGDAAMTDKDQYGAALCWNMGTDAFLNACDIPIIETGKDGNPSLLGLTDKYVELYEFLKTFYQDSGNALQAANEITNLIFEEGRALLGGFPLMNALTYRDMETDFGIIPYPKWDKAQESYYSFCNMGDATGYVVPVTADPEMIGCVLEAMAYYGYQDILPEYYEKALKGKGARDDESAEMLDIIYNSVGFEFTQIYSGVFGNQQAPSMMLRMAFKNNQELASMWAERENLYKETMEKLIATLK